MRLRVDNVGSMLRPAELKSAFERHDAGQATEDELGQAQDAAIAKLIAGNRLSEEDQWRKLELVPGRVVWGGDR